MKLAISFDWQDTLQDTSYEVDGYKTGKQHDSSYLDNSSQHNTNVELKGKQRLVRSFTGWVISYRDMEFGPEMVTNLGTFHARCCLTSDNGRDLIGSLI